MSQGAGYCASLFFPYIFYPAFLISPSRNKQHRGRWWHAVTVHTTLKSGIHSITVACRFCITDVHAQPWIVNFHYTSKGDLSVISLACHHVFFLRFISFLWGPTTLSSNGFTVSHLCLTGYWQVSWYTPASFPCPFLSLGSPQSLPRPVSRPRWQRCSCSRFWNQHLLHFLYIAYAYLLSACAFAAGRYHNINPGNVVSQVTYLRSLEWRHLFPCYIRFLLKSLIGRLFPFLSIFKVT